jgi:RNA polymerase sigma-70 factor, ECF subfamily
MGMRARSGDSEESRRDFEVFFRTHFNRLTQYVGLRAPRAQVDDVVAATFIVAWKKFRFVENPSLPWLFRIASFEVRSADRAARRSGRVVNVATMENAPIPSRDHFDGTAVLAALSRLSPADQELLRLIHWDELTRPEAAEVLGVTVNALNVRYHRALSKLEQQMSPVTTASPEGAPQ